MSTGEPSGDIADQMLANSICAAGFDKGHALHAVVRTAVDLTIVCAEPQIPEPVEADRGYRCFRVMGTERTCVRTQIHALTAPLSANGIVTLIVVTSSNALLLVRHADVLRARELLATAGREFEE